MNPKFWLRQSTSSVQRTRLPRIKIAVAHFLVGAPPAHYICLRPRGAIGNSSHKLHPMSPTTPWPSIAALGDEIGAAIIRHLDLSFRDMIRTNPGAVATPSYMRLLTGLDHPYGNFAVLPGSADDQVAVEAILPLVEKNIPSCVILTAPAAPAVTALLASKGFEKHEPMPAMAVEINHLAATSLPDGYTFHRVRVTPSEIDEWAITFADGFEFPHAIAQLYAPKTSEHDTPEPDAITQYFAIAKNGKYVATSMLYLKEGLAGIYCVATIPSERGKGLGAHATAEPLRLAQNLGYRVGLLQASEAGQPVYGRLGFKEYDSLPVYVRIPKA